MEKVRAHLTHSGLILLIICLFALSIRLLCFSALRPWDEGVAKNRFFGAESPEYHRLAVSIIDSRSFSGFCSGRTPGYPLFIAFIYFLFGVKPWIVFFSQVLIDTAIVIITYLLAAEVFESKQVSLITAFLYSISFPSAYYSVTFFSETLFTLFLTVSVLTFIKSLKRNTVWGFALTGFFIGLAALTRPIAQYFVLVVLIALLFTDNKLVQKLRNVLLLIIIFLATISPWQFRNLRAFDHYALSSFGGYQLCRHQVAITKAHTDKISFREAQKELVGNSLEGITNPFEESRIYEKIALAYIVRHPLQYTKYHFKGVLRMFLGTARSGMSELLGIKTERAAIMEPLLYTAHKPVKNFRNELPTLIIFLKQIIEYLFLIIGLIFICLKDRRLLPFFLVAIILYFAALTGATGYSRSRIPIISFYLIISAKGMFEVFKFVRKL